MDTTRESPLETEVRLRGVLARSEVTFRAGTWCFEELADGEGPTSARDDALALVQNGRCWSQLVPLEDGGTADEPLAVWSVEFPEDAPNSGFVGWLASRIKERTGAGVLVVCGYDSRRGGVYDHWGCLESSADEVRAVIEALRTRAPASGRLDLDDRLMNAVSTASTGVVDARTIFHFRQKGRRVWARYHGGEIERGFLCGRLDGRDLHFRFAQVQVDGKVDGGASDGELEWLDDGRLQIRERFEWSSRGGVGENLIAELPLA